MNSLERVLTAVRGGTPDRVPIVELDIDDSVIQEIMPGATQLDFYDEFDIDGIHVIYDIQYEDVGPNLKRDFFRVTVNFKAMHGFFPTPVEPLIKADMDPLKFLETYKMPDPYNPKILESLRQTVKRLKGKKAIVFGMHTGLIYPIFVRGMENFMVDYYKNPEFAHRLSGMFTDFFVEVEKQAIEIGADIILEGEDYAGNKNLWMSVDHLKEFVLPGLRKAIRVAKDAGVPFVKHTDGNINSILDLLVEQGIDCLNPIEPNAGMDIGKVKRMIGDKVALWGNIDCSHLLPFGSTEEVEKATIECIKTASPGGGHIIASSNTVHDSVPAKNFVAMVKAAREFGKYPIKV